MDAMPAVKPGEVGAQGMPRDTQSSGHFLVREIGGNQANDLGLSWCEPRDRAAAEDKYAGLGADARLNHGTSVERGLRAR